MSEIPKRWAPVDRQEGEASFSKCTESQLPSPSKGFAFAPFHHFSGAFVQLIFELVHGWKFARSPLLTRWLQSRCLLFLEYYWVSLQLSPDLSKKKENPVICQRFFRLPCSRLVLSAGLPSDRTQTIVHYPSSSYHASQVTPLSFYSTVIFFSSANISCNCCPRCITTTAALKADDDLSNITRLLPKKPG